VGQVGADQVQLYAQDGKLYAQLSSNDAVLVADLSVGSVPVGAVNAYAGSSTAPTGWLLCSGDALPNGTGTVQGQTADFSALYSLVSTTYGTAGTLPDLTGRVIAQEDTASSYDRGVASGAAAVSLAAANIPEHTHTASLDSGSVTVSQSTSDEVWMRACYDDGDSFQSKGYKFLSRATTCGNSATNSDLIAASAENSLADLLSGSIGTGVTVGNALGDGSGGVNDVDVRQPTLYMNYIIKF
tara:strand:- start:6960 stop:7685 length:726 start_codon:yes stop_codon:yes gene_type:complete